MLYPTVSIVPHSTADIELLSLKAYKKLQKASVIVCREDISMQMLKKMNVKSKLCVSTSYADSLSRIRSQAGTAVILFHDNGHHHEHIYQLTQLLDRHQISYELIPHVSSLTAHTSPHTIPVTNRGMSRSVIRLQHPQCDQSTLTKIKAALSTGATLQLFGSASQLHYVMNALIALGAPDHPTLIKNIKHQTHQINPLYESDHIRLSPADIYLMTYGQNVALSPSYTDLLTPDPLHSDQP